MADPAHPDPRPPAADGEREEGPTFNEALAYIRPHKLTNGDGPVILKAGMLRCCVSEILMREADLLSRLTAAEAGREEAEARVEKLETALTWYVENDDVNLNDPGNEFWIDGYNRARALLPEAPPQGDP